MALKTLIQFRKDVEANRSGVTFSSAEPAWVTDTKKLYVGDGTTAGGVEVIMLSDVDNTPVNGASYPISSDWAYKIENEAVTINGAWTFSSILNVDNAIYLEHANPYILFTESDQALDEKNWFLHGNGSNLLVKTWNDAKDTAVTAAGFFRGDGNTFSHFTVYGLISANSGNLQVNRLGNAEAGVCTIITDAGQTGRYGFHTGSTARWTIDKTDTAETGSDAGSNFVIARYNDAGVSQGNAITITRSDGRVDIAGDLYPNSNVIAGGGFIHINRDSDATNAIFYLTRDAGYVGLIQFRTGNSPRWQIYTDAGAETGSDAGSNFQIARYNDAGTYQDSPVLITRSTGKITTSGDLSVGGILSVATSGQINSSNILTEADVDDVPVDSATVAPISSNWAYDHENAADPHSVYPLAAGDETISGQWTFTGAAYAFNNAGAQIRLDSSAQKGIYCNDGAGNFIIRAGHRQYDPGAGSDERHPVAGDGAAKITFSTDAQAGSIAILVGSGTAALADDPVVWGTGVFLNNSGFYLGNSAVEANRFVYQGLAATITGSWDFQGGVTIDGVGQATQVDMHIDADAGHAAVVIGRTAGSNRWKWGKDGTAESGSNAGSNFSIQRYTDAGAYVDTPLTINRASGKTTLQGDAAVAGLLQVDRSGDAADATMSLLADSGQTARVALSTGSSTRWSIDKNNNAESTGDAGSDFALNRYSDAGASLGTAIHIVRSTGAMTLSGALSVTGAATFDENPTLNKIGDAEDATWQTASDAGNFAGVRIQTGATLRWLIGKNYEAETGSDAGSNFHFRRYDDAGTYKDSPISIQRSDGQITLSGYTQFTNFIEIERVAPQIRFYETDAAVDTKRWRWIADGGFMDLRIYSDSEASNATVIRFNRSGVTPGQISMFGALGVSGNIFTNAGYLQVNRVGDTTDAAIYIDRDAGERGLIAFRTGTSSRWILETNGAAEAGSDAGSDFILSRYSDAGALLDTSLRVYRSNGDLHVTNNLYALTNVIVTGGFVHVNRQGDAAAAHVYISGDAGQNRIVNFRTGASMRWQVLADNTAESGSDVGSDFKIARYNDSGAYQDAPIIISRASGQVAITNALKVQKIVYNDAINDEGNSGAALTIDWGLGNFAECTLTNNTTLTFTDPAGPAFLYLKLTQNATGGYTVTWPSTVKTTGGGGVTITTTANAVNTVVLAYDGSIYYMVSNGANIS